MNKLLLLGLLVITVLVVVGVDEFIVAATVVDEVSVGVVDSNDDENSTNGFDITKN